MILEQLRVHNFGAFQGEHSIDLRVTPQRPVVLIGALNGSGKTTLLEATQLALFGRAVRSTSRAKMAYPDYLAQLINRNVAPEVGAGVALTFRHRSSGQDDLFTITRTWRKAGAGIKEEIEVLRNGALDTDVTSRWLEFVEEFLPVQLADLFLFDGERIESLADPDRSSEFLKAGIHALLGLDLVDHLARTLSVHERGKRTKGKDARKEREHLEQAEAHLAALMKDREGLNQDLAAARNNATQADKELAKARQRLDSAGGLLLADREQIAVQVRQAERELERSVDSLRELAGGEAPLLLLGDLLVDAESLAVEVEAQGKAANVLGVLSTRDRDLEDLLSSLKVSKAAHQKIAGFLATSRERWASAAETLPAVGVLPTGFEQLTAASLTSLREEVRGRLRAHAKSQEDLGTAEARKNALPSEGTLAPLVEAVEKAEVARATAAATVELLAAELAKRDAQIDRAERDVRRAQEAVREIDLKDEVDARIIRHSIKARQTLVQFRQAVAARNVGRLADLISTRFRQILRKGDSLVDRVSIDPQTFLLTLQDNSGRLIDPLLLSAGERQLLAVAVVWALAAASGRRLPTMIDTPLGRLDGEHRSKLVEGYFPKASDQVILLSTDEEVNGRYYTKLKPRIAREYLVAFDPTTRSSRIESGYFEQMDREVA